MITVRDILVEYLIDNPEDLKSYMLDAMDLIHGEAQRKNHEFEGYFVSKWKEASETLSQFNEQYFDDVDRKWLYVYLSAMIDDEILSFLDDAYEVICQPPLSREKIQLEINKLIEKGTRF